MGSEFYPPGRGRAGRDTSHTRRDRTALLLLLAALLACAVAPAGGAWARARVPRGSSVPPPPPPVPVPPAGVNARFVTPFQMTGTITYARHVLHERAGQVLSRAWTIATPPECPAGPCPTLVLTRPRAGGVDTVPLTLTAPGTWSGSGIFYVPERCGRRRYPQGGKVLFAVTVVATAAAIAPDGTPVVTAVWGSYVNPARYNLTPCPGGLGADAAVYTGTPILPAPAPPPPLPPGGAPAPGS
jgi:hypothetical protein